MKAIRDWLHIGNHNDLKSLAQGNQAPIDSILNLAGDLEIGNKTTLFLDIEDGKPLKEGDVITGTEFLLREYYKGRKILIACGAGISRSATFCILLLREVENLSLIEAYRSIKSVYPKALPHPELWESVCGFYDELFDYPALLRG